MKRRTVRQPKKPTERNLEIHCKVLERKLTYKEIGVQYGLSLQRIHQIALEVDGWLAIDHRKNVDAIFTRHTRRLEGYIEKMEAAYVESCQEQETRKAISTMDASGQPQIARVERTTKKLIGDPRFIAEARGALEDIRKMWRPKDLRVEHVGQLDVTHQPLNLTSEKDFDDDEQLALRIRPDTGGET